MTEIARRPAGALAVNPTQTDWTPDQRAALDSLGIDDTATAGDLRVFLTYAQRTGLDPFARQIYLIGRPTNEIVGNYPDGRPKWRSRKRYSIQVGIDGFRVIAARTGKYRGQIGPEWCGEDGLWREVWLSSEPPAAARVAVLHADHPAPMWAVALLAEYAPRNKDTGAMTGQWPKMPSLMLAKVAEALALRKAFPNDLSGIYVAEEMDQAGPRPVTANTPTRTLSELVDLSTREGVDVAELRAIWREAAAGGLLDEDVVDTATGEVVKLRDHLGDLVTALETPDETSGRVPDPPIAADEKGEDGAAASVPSDDPWAAPVKGAES